MNIGPDDMELSKRVDTSAAGGDPELETALRRALKPVDAPFGFADRVLSRALVGDGASTSLNSPSGPVSGGAESLRVRKDAGKLLHWPQYRPWITGAVAAGLVAGVLGSSVAVHHMHEHERQVEEATRQFQTTERVTGRALAQARVQLERAGVPLNLE